MKHFFILISLAGMFCYSLSAQERITNLHFSGYRVVIVPSETFSIEIKNPELGTQKIKGNSLRLEITDQRGRVPKDTVVVHTDKIDFLYLHNSELEIGKQFVTDSLKLNALSSSGIMNIKADYLKINLAADSQLQVRGEARHLIANVRAGSKFDSKSLLTDIAEIKTTGYSTSTTNTESRSTK